MISSQIIGGSYDFSKIISLNNQIKEKKLLGVVLLEGYVNRTGVSYSLMHGRNIKTARTDKLHPDRRSTPRTADERAYLYDYFGVPIWDAMCDKIKGCLWVFSAWGIQAMQFATIKPILSCNFYTFITFMLGSQFLFP